MQRQGQRSSTVLSTLAICANVALVGATYWLTGPGVDGFNAFNERLFGQYYTAGAILMIGFYGLAFFAIVGIAVVATAIAWFRRGHPRWLTWIATITTALAPVAAVGFL